MKTTFNITLIINPKNKIYKTFMKRGFMKIKYPITLKSLRCPLIGEKIYLNEYTSDLPEDLSKYLKNRNIPLVFEVEDIVTSDFSNSISFDKQRQLQSIYLKVSEVENYNPFNY